MSRYLVKRPWGGVKAGDIIETDNLSPALLSHVELVKEDRSLEVATPKQSRKRRRKEEDPGGDA